MQIDSNTLAVIEKLRENGITIVRKLEHRIKVAHIGKNTATLEVGDESVTVFEGDTVLVKTEDPVVEF